MLAPRRVALAGPMGAGKTTVGRLLAARWSVVFVDLDLEIGDIPSIWAAEGEAGFRRREHQALAIAAAREGVLALGGGALVALENRRLLSGWRVVVLMARAETLRDRIGLEGGRPLADQLEELLVARASSYGEAGPVVWTDGIAADLVALRVEELC